MTFVAVETEIEASAANVWRVLTDLEAYPTWNPFIVSARGSLARGGTVHLRVHTRFGIPLAFTAMIVENLERSELRWSGTFGGRWIASGDHRFVVEPLGEHRCLLIQSERFGGVLPRIARRLVDPEAVRGFSAMNRALAERAELAERSEHRAVS